MKIRVEKKSETVNVLLDAGAGNRPMKLTLTAGELKGLRALLDVALNAESFSFEYEAGKG